MNMEAVRCWWVENGRPKSGTIDRLFITYPEENSGHDLITCLTCGQVYAVSIAKEVYVGPPRPEKLRGMKCVNCSSPLHENYATYPETYVVDGVQYRFTRDDEIPPDSMAIVKEFYEIYA